MKKIDELQIRQRDLEFAHEALSEHRRELLLLQEQVLERVLGGVGSTIEFMGEIANSKFESMLHKRLLRLCLGFAVQTLLVDELKRQIEEEV